jgi:hypoxanthine-guanine phosphoribosyltransferase
MEGRGTLSEIEDTITLPEVSPHAEAYERDIERVLITEAEIQQKLRELGARITEDYVGKDLLLIGVLKGAFVVMADLSRHIHLPVETDFMAVASYGAATKTRASSASSRTSTTTSRGATSCSSRTSWTPASRSTTC